MKNIIESDFREILESGLAGTLEFEIKQRANENSEFYLLYYASVPATVEETTQTVDVLPGGTRLRRSFSATLLRNDLKFKYPSGSAGFIQPMGRFTPKVGDAVTYNGEKYRIRLVACDESSPLVRLDFSEK
ncbi:MAG: hypothetical protein E7037_08220 [Verrucomicrobia bacterium]|nr:hypothetical protein [Verrucomicrobiota bacterium]